MLKSLSLTLFQITRNTRKGPLIDCKIPSPICGLQVTRLPKPSQSVSVCSHRQYGNLMQRKSQPFRVARWYFCHERLLTSFPSQPRFVVMSQWPTLSPRSTLNVVYVDSSEGNLYKKRNELTTYSSPHFVFRVTCNLCSYEVDRCKSSIKWLLFLICLMYLETRVWF